MSTYTPDRWVIVELKTPKETLFKVLASWYGGYLGSDSWKMSSGITKVNKTEHGYEFDNFSGSVYVCNKNTYGMSMYTAGVYSSFEKKISDEKTTDIGLRVLDQEEVDNITLTSSGM